MKLNLIQQSSHCVEESILVFPEWNNGYFSSALHIQTTAEKDGEETGGEGQRKISMFVITDDKSAIKENEN